MNITEARHLINEAEASNSWVWVRCGKHDYQLPPEVAEYEAGEDGRYSFWSVAKNPHPRDTHHGLRWLYLDRCKFSHFTRKA
jgi:hypothetical protein